MAARRKSTKRTDAAATPKQRTTSALRAKRGGTVKGRLSSNRAKAAVKPKEKSASSKKARKRSDAKAAAQSSTRSRTRAGNGASTNANAQAKTEQKERCHKRKGLDDGKHPELEASGSEIANEERAE